MNDSQVYEVDIDIDTRQRVWEVTQKEEVKATLQQVRDQQKAQTRQIRLMAGSDYSTINESLGGEEKA